MADITSEQIQELIKGAVAEALKANAAAVPTAPVAEPEFSPTDKTPNQRAHPDAPAWKPGATYWKPGTKPENVL